MLENLSVTTGDFLVRTILLLFRVAVRIKEALLAVESHSTGLQGWVSLASVERRGGGIFVCCGPPGSSAALGSSIRRPAILVKSDWIDVTRAVGDSCCSSQVFVRLFSVLTGISAGEGGATIDCD